MLHSLLQEEEEEEGRTTTGIGGLVVTPTRELALQIWKECEKVCCRNVKMGCIVGGLSEEKQKRVINDGVRVLVATVGRLWDMISSRQYKALNELPQTLRYFVIDEVDRMFSKSHPDKTCYPQLDLLLEFFQVPEEVLKRRQTLLFSATLTLHNGQETIFSQLLQKMGSNDHAAPATVKTIDLTARHGKGDDGRPSAMMPQSARLPPGLTLRQVLCTQLHKDLHVYTILTSCIAPGPVLLFCNSVKGAKRVSETLIALMGEGRIKLLVGDMAQVSS
jgi:ATP-dependent RNA helicase DDX24/MAK5